MKSLTAITLLVLFAGSFAQNSTSSNIVSCALNQTDDFCSATLSTSGACCAVVNYQTRTATTAAWVNQTSFQCLSAELVRANSTIVYTTLIQATYSCVSATNVAAVKTCDDNDGCDAGFCCANRTGSWRQTGNAAVAYAQPKACSAQPSVWNNTVSWTFTNSTAPTSILSMTKVCNAQQTKTNGVYLKGISAVIVALIASAFY